MCIRDRSDSGGNIIDSPHEMVDEFNSYFASVFTSENLHQLPTAVNMFCGSADDRCQDVIFSEAEVAKTLQGYVKIKLPDQTTYRRGFFSGSRIR